MWAFDFSIMISANILSFIWIILVIFLILYIVKQVVLIQQIIKKQNEKNLQIDNKIQELKNQIKNFSTSRYLEKALNKNWKNFSEKKMAFLEEQYHKIMNSYKILYFSKMSNLILDRLFNIHGTKFSKTEAIFLNDEKPEFKEKKFPIICVGKSFDKILNVDKYLINLIIDFLIYMKDFTSSFIHLSEYSYSFQIKILSQYIGHKMEIINNKYYINSEELINLIFQQNNTNNKIGEEPRVKKNLNINIIDNIDNKIDNNHEISTTINNNKLLNNNMKEPEEYSTEISDICKSVISNSHHNQNVKSDFGKVGQRNIEKKNSNNNNEKNININLNEPLNEDDISIKDKPFINNQKSSLSVISKTGKIKKNKFEVNKINKEKDEIIIKKEEVDDENNEDEKEDEKCKNLKKNNKTKKKGKKIDIKKEDKKDKFKKEGKKIKNHEGGKENKEEVKTNGKKKENEKDNSQRKDTEEKTDEDKKEIKNEVKKNYEKKEDEIQKEKEKLKEEEQGKKDIEKTQKKNFFNDKLNQDLSKNEVDIDTLKNFDNLIIRLEGSDKKQNLNKILNNEIKNHENAKSYSYDIKEIENVLLNDDFQFKDDKVDIIKEIKEYVIKTSQIKSNEMNEIIKIDTNYIFNSWCNTFGKGYKKMNYIKN